MALANLFQNVKLYTAALRGARAEKGATSERAHELGIPIYVINLERNKERRDFITRYLAGLGLSPRIFPAVNGRALDLPELEKSKIYVDAIAHEKFSRSLSMAEIGCALSHLRLYQTLVDERIEAAIVLEDDAVLSPNFVDQLSALRTELPDDWDLVQLICGCRDGEHVGPHVFRYRSQTCIPVAAAGYLLRQSGARKLLEEGYPVRYPADSLIGRSPRWGTNVYGADPQLVTINNVFPSEIGHGNTWKMVISDAVKKVLVKVLK